MVKIRKQDMERRRNKRKSIPRKDFLKVEQPRSIEKQKLIFSFSCGVFLGICATIFSFFIFPLEGSKEDSNQAVMILEAGEVNIPEFPKVFIAEEALPEGASSDEELSKEIVSEKIPSYPVIKKDLPKEGVSKKEVWQDFAVKVSNVPASAPKVAIIIDDLGIDKKRTLKIIELSGAITTSFITYANNLPKQIKEAKKNGKEIMLHIPMEAQSSVDTGPQSLTTHMSALEVSEVLKKNLSSDLLSQGVVGVNNHMGSKFTKDMKSMKHFMKAYSSYGLFFIDSRTIPGSLGVSIADSMGVATAGRNVFIDNKDEVSYILGQLHLLEQEARKRGFAIGIGHPHDGTIKALQEWIPSLSSKGIYLVPVSYIVKERLATKKARDKV